ncbi:unnamed protein product [Enterobius vermicularis]|uniref:Anoctamin n=1 Tax=Enterobius vermicularis TaxID=51028 RepID=A0A0N4VB69_ENTVE|nr:unnamed protein product [Enterobius vermicularis]
MFLKKFFGCSSSKLENVKKAVRASDWIENELEESDYLSQNFTGGSDYEDFDNEYEIEYRASSAASSRIIKLCLFTLCTACYVISAVCLPLFGYFYCHHKRLQSERIWRRQWIKNERADRSNRPSSPVLFTGTSYTFSDTQTSPGTPHTVSGT